MEMKSWNTSMGEYQVKVVCSPVFETALAIAAITRPEVMEKLERTPTEWRALWEVLPEAVRGEVQRAGEVHTWRSLLFLAHRCPGLLEVPPAHHVEHLCTWLDTLENDVIEAAAPFLGWHHKDTLVDAFGGNRAAKALLLETFADNPLIQLNLKYLFDASPASLREHLTSLLRGWYNHTDVHQTTTLAALQTDALEKRKLATALPIQELVRVATKGLSLHPEPRVETVLLIPQLAYRPFTIVNSLPGCSVFYYPLADSNVPGETGAADTLRIAALYKAIGDAHRVKILKRLRQGKHSLAELAEYLQLAKSTTHHHLTLLRAAGVVSAHDGIYALLPQPLLAMHEQLHAFLSLQEDADDGPH